jgi:Endosomal/lysosomal potassium channel TMEM175
VETNRLEAFSDGVLAIIITIYIFVALLWLVPDRRLKRVIEESSSR